MICVLAKNAIICIYANRRAVNSCFVIELRFGDCSEFLCVRSDLSEAIEWCEAFDISKEDTEWESIAILNVFLNPDQDSVNTASRIIWKKEY